MRKRKKERKKEREREREKERERERKKEIQMRGEEDLNVGSRDEYGEEI